jgi:hypothetical protein
MLSNENLKIVVNHILTIYFFQKGCFTALLGKVWAFWLKYDQNYELWLFYYAIIKTISVPNGAVLENCHAYMGIFRSLKLEKIL